MTASTKYFAYGSNCNSSIMQRKGVEVVSRRRAVLHGYRLLFNKKSLRDDVPADVGFANINEDVNGQVEGILYEISTDQLGRLDESERYPDHYDRILITVATDAGDQPCCTYQARPDKIADGLVPSRNYLNHILAAGDFLSQQYYEALDTSHTYKGDCASCGKLAEAVFIRESEQLYMLCQACREARLAWGEVRGRKLTVPETEAVMKQLVLGGQGFDSIGQLVQEAIEAKIIAP